MTTVAIHQPQYLPWIPYFDKADRCDVFVYLDNVQFQSRGVQNRNMIKGVDGARWLTVPVHAERETLIKDVLICDDHWRREHVKSIQHSYARAAAFDSVAPVVFDAFDTSRTCLADLNIALTQLFFRQLGIGCRSVRASELEVTGSKSELILNICKLLNADAYLSGVGAKSYLRLSEFQKSGIEVVFQDYTAPAYRQCYPEIGFIRDLSMLDLLLNVGDAAADVMRSGRETKYVSLSV